MMPLVLLRFSGVAKRYRVQGSILPLEPRTMEFIPQKWLLIEGVFGVWA